MPIFFFQAEDGIRDATVTGVQTCALPILPTAIKPSAKTQDANTREFSGSTTGRNSEASARVQFWLLATQYRYSRQPERCRFSDGAKVAFSALERESRVCCHWMLLF